MKKLSEKESAVMVKKQMEAPFLNAYYLHEDEGKYCCRQCGLDLFASSSKFHSGSGWPCFDESFPNAVNIVLDQKSQKEECFCSSCQGFLGYRFRKEEFTTKNVRYNISSLALRFRIG